jgi:hypothetical protein
MHWLESSDHYSNRFFVYSQPFFLFTHDEALTGTQRPPLCQWEPPIQPPPCLTSTAVAAHFWANTSHLRIAHSHLSHLAMGAAVTRDAQAAEGENHQKSEAGDGRTVKFEDEDDEAQDQQKARRHLMLQKLR